MATQGLSDLSFKDWASYAVKDLQLDNRFVRPVARIHQATSTTTDVNIGTDDVCLVATQSYNLASNASSSFRVLCEGYSNDDAVFVAIHSFENTIGAQGIPVVIKKTRGVSGEFDIVVGNSGTNNLVGVLVISIQIIRKKL